MLLAEGGGGETTSIAAGQDVGLPIGAERGERSAFSSRWGRFAEGRVDRGGDITLFASVAAGGCVAGEARSEVWVDLFGGTEGGGWHRSLGPGGKRGR